VEAVLRGLAIYVVLILLFRLAGKRTRRQATTSDLLLLIILGETVQVVLAGKDVFTFRAAIALILLLVGADKVLDYLSAKAARERRLKSGPMLLVENGELLADRIVESGVTEEEILTHARRSRGLEGMHQIQYAVLEKTGGIGIVPRGAGEEDTDPNLPRTDVDPRPG
jgi:uncharacterized membrane protein YcaP (DUF421 family)